MEALSGRVALVTGASRGIGRAIAVALAREGADVAVNYLRSEDAAQEVERDITALGRRCLLARADVSRSADVSRMVEAITQGLGTIDILVNNAGLSRPLALDAISEQDWNETLAANLTSVFLVTRAVLPGMRARHFGRIINLSSVAAQIGGLVGPHYAASKAGVLGLTHAHASLLVREGITVNAIAPALVDTDMVKAMPLARPDRIPLGRYGTVEETAEVAVMLARNGYITGQTLNVNGGLYMS